MLVVKEHVFLHWHRGVAWPGEGACQGAPQEGALNHLEVEVIGVVDDVFDEVVEVKESDIGAAIFEVVYQLLKTVVD